MRCSVSTIMEAMFSGNIVPPWLDHPVKVALWRLQIRENYHQIESD